MGEESQKCVTLVSPLMCIKRLSPESQAAGSQASAGLNGTGNDRPGVAIAPEVLPGGSDWQGGGSGQEGGARD